MQPAERDTMILAAVFEKPRTIPEITDATRISRTAVQRRVRRLEQLGRVVRHSDDTYSLANPIATSPTGAAEDRRFPRGPLGFWDRRELGRQLDLAKLLALEDIREALMADVREKAKAVVEDHDPKPIPIPTIAQALDRREGEVYERFGLEFRKTPPSTDRSSFP